MDTGCAISWRLSDFRSALVWRRRPLRQPSAAHWDGSCDFSVVGRRLTVVLINAFFGLPPVVVGLVLYLARPGQGHWASSRCFSRRGMVIAQTILAIPIIAALVHRASERAWARYGDELLRMVRHDCRHLPQILMIIRADVVTAVLAGFGRTVSEVGAVILVGGNISRLDQNDHHDDCPSNKPGRTVIGVGSGSGVGRDQHFDQRDGFRTGRTGANGWERRSMIAFRYVRCDRNSGCDKCEYCRREFHRIWPRRLRSKRPGYWQTFSRSSRRGPASLSTW